MKIVLPTLPNGHINGHFGHSEMFTVFTTGENGQILSKEPVSAMEGCGCKSDIIPALAQMGVTVCLAGNMGPGAAAKFERNGIVVVRGCAGDAESIVKAYLTGAVADSGESCGHHEHHGHDHHHDHGHSCNHHS